MDQYFNPVQVFLGTNCIREMSSLLENMKLQEKTALLLQWNDSVSENEDVKKIIEENSELTWNVRTFEKSNPETTDLYELYTQTKDLSVGIVIAIGGGSVLDVAKSLCCLYGENISSEQELVEGLKEKRYQNPSCKWIGVPTTAGTGSEVTCWATIWNPAENSKLSLECKSNYAYAAYVDSQFAASMPVKLAVSSALDAVAHATEAYWAKGSNSVSKAFSLRAIRLIMEHIEGLFEEEKAEESHGYMATGSVLAGMAFSNTRTTACHSLSYPLTLKYQIPHGIAVSMLLLPVMKVNAKAVERMQDLLEAFCVKDMEELETKINCIMQQANIPFTLREWKVEREDLDFLAEHGGTKGRIDNNPVDLNKEQIVTILESIYEK